MSSVSRVSIGPHGPEVSRFIAGFWRLNSWGMNKQELLSFVEQCLELGISTMDHAMVYRSEAPFGEALALNPSLRDQMEIVTKCGIRAAGLGGLGVDTINHYDSSESHILKSVDASLMNLNTDHLDVLLLHRPDFLMDFDEVAQTFQGLKQSGKVLHFGVSNFTSFQFEGLQEAMLRFTNEGLVTNQIQFSPYHLEALGCGVLDQCQSTNASPMLWSCLAGGDILSPKDEKGDRILKALKIVAGELNMSAIEPIVYAWVLNLPGNPLPLLGSSKIDRLKVALQADSLSLSREQWYRVWEASTGSPVP